MSPARWLAALLVLLGLIAGLVFAITGAGGPTPDRAETPAAPPAPFGFPQHEATVVRDDAMLRVSVWNNDEHLLVQAVVWADRDATLGLTRDQREIGDQANLLIDADASGSDTPNDRTYWINPWPSRPGLRYQVSEGGGRRTHIRGDSAGRGSVGYVENLAPGSPAAVRVDTYAIPLEEIGVSVGSTIRVGYWCYSPVPTLYLNSTDFAPPGEYWGYQVPTPLWDLINLVPGRPPLDVLALPDGRDGAPPPAPAAPPVGAGREAPELAAKGWINTDEPLTLAALRGRPVLVEFWSSNCATCLSQIPHLNRLHDVYGPLGLAVIAFTEQGGEPIDYVVKREEIRYVVGTGSKLRDSYGAPSTPYAFLLGPDGRVLWHGVPSEPELDRQVEALLGGS